MTSRQKNNFLPLSVFIIAKNEEDRIEGAIHSIKGWVDEIVVVDSGSTDNTVEKARESGATKVVFNEWSGYGPQKNYAQSLCKNKWILNIDADERVTESLRKEIVDLFASGKLDSKVAYDVAIKFAPRFSKFNEKSKGPQERVTRLYNIDNASFKMSKVHDSVSITRGKLGHLKHKIKHDCFRDFSHALAKINHYTDMQAEDMFARGRNPNMLRIITEPIWTFFRSLFYEKYFYLGVEGILMSIIYSISRTMRLIKARERFMGHDS